LIVGGSIRVVGKFGKQMWNQIRTADPPPEAIGIETVCGFNPQNEKPVIVREK
jgi:hypothetical protein